MNDIDDILGEVEWIPWKKPLHHEDEGPRNDALGMAESWLGDFGLGFGFTNASPPDAWAKLDNDRFAFRVDSMGKSVAIVVSICYDAEGTPGGGGWQDRSQCFAVEVRRL